MTYMYLVLTIWRQKRQLDGDIFYEVKLIHYIKRFKYIRFFYKEPYALL